MDNEYEIDMFMDYILPEWNFLYWANPTGIRIVSGSMDIKRFYLDEEIKIRFTLLKEKLWTRFFHKRMKTIDFEDNLNEIEFEYLPVENIFISILGTPEFRKHEVDIGWAIRYAKDEANGIKVTYILTDFDNNYAFHNRTVNLGFEKFYQKMSKEWRLEIKKNDDRIKGRIYFEYNTKSVFDYEDLLNANNNYRAKNEGYKIDSNFNLSLPLADTNWTVGSDFYIRENKKSKKFVVSQVARRNNFSSSEKKYTIRPYIEKKVLRNLKIFSGVSFTKHKYTISYPYALMDDYDYKRENIGGFLIGYFNLIPKVVLEVGYLHDTVDWDKNSDNGHNRENRLNLGCGYKFSEKSQIKFVTGWELDKEDLGKFAIFDGAHIQFQTIF